MRIPSEHVIAATNAVRASIENTQGPLPPAFVVEFLVRSWRRVLAAFHMNYGDGSKTWAVATAAMERLLWSATPKKTPTERGDLMRALRPLVDDLRAGMDHVGVLAAEQSAFLDRLSEFHLRMMQDPDPTGTDLGEISGTHLTDTIPMNVHDPQYQKLLDMLDAADVEQIDI